MNYQYNGFSLPRPPAINKAERPYLHISYGELDIPENTYSARLLATSHPATMGADGELSWPDGAEWEYYHCTNNQVYADAMAYPYGVNAWGDASTEGAMLDGVQWANYDILNEDGTVYLAASVPVPEGIVHAIKNDMQFSGVRPRIDVMQGDEGTRVLEITLLAAGLPWCPPTDSAVVITYCRSDGIGGAYDTMRNGTPACGVYGNVVLAHLVPEITGCIGITRVAVRLISAAGDVISTFGIDVAVEEDPAMRSLRTTGGYFNFQNALPAVSIADNGKLLGVENGVWAVVDAPDGDGETVYVTPDPPVLVSISKSDLTQTDDNWYGYYYITVDSTYANGVKETSVITLDHTEKPISVTRNGVECALTWEGF